MKRFKNNNLLHPTLHRCQIKQTVHVCCGIRLMRRVIPVTGPYTAATLRRRVMQSKDNQSGGASPRVFRCSKCTFPLSRRRSVLYV